jgi:hypothetical protein
VTMPMPITTTKTNATTKTTITTISIANRKPLQGRTVDAIIHEARERGATACPVLNRQGTTDEVHLFRDGQLQASIFRPAEGGLGVWRADYDQTLAGSVSEAVQRGLDSLRKSQRKAA